MFPSNGTLTVYKTDGMELSYPVRFRAGSLYAAQSESVNFNAKVGASLYFQLSAKDLKTFRPALNKDDTRIILTTTGAAYEVTNVHDYESFFKCPAVKCKQHGDKWV